MADPIPLVVNVPAEDMDTVEALVAHLQAADPALSIDDCIDDIFLTGLTATAHRLISLEPLAHEKHQAIDD